MYCGFYRWASSNEARNLSTIPPGPGQRFGKCKGQRFDCVSYVRVRRSVAERVPYEGNIFLCDQVKSPFILGLIRPKIYLPSNMDVMAMEPVIAHEKAHLARRDHWWKPMGFLILAVH